MEKFVGKPISSGYAEGKAFKLEYQSITGNIPSYSIQEMDIDQECSRFEIALKNSRLELEHLCSHFLQDFGEKEAKIFSAHLAFILDEEFISKVKNRIVSDLINVEQALFTEINDFTAVLTEMKNEYIKERASDIVDIGNRILKNLIKQKGERSELIPPNSVLLAPELYPSDTLNLKRNNISAIVTERGGDTSHGAILARSLNIPAVTGVKGIMEKVENGFYLLVDGEEGIITVEPSSDNIRLFAVKQGKYLDRWINTEEKRKQACATKDGEEISLLANIGRPYEIDLVNKYNLSGAGLFRTEYLFISRNDPPEEPEQFEVYRDMASSLPNKPLTIRTFDLGADKLASFLSLEHETNPYMGLRGLHLSLKERNLFKTQIRAILRANECGQIRILLPMVIQKEDIVETRNILSEEAESMGINMMPSLGIMVETPAAVFCLQSMLEEADFISIGTNDLTQFLLATDRNSPELMDIRSVLNPAVLKALLEILKVTNKMGTPVSICGEAASEPLIASLFVGLGFRQLSMSPLKTDRVKHMLRLMTTEHLQDLAYEAVLRQSGTEVWNFLKDYTGKGVLELTDT